jgi:hypothetical protein
MFAVDGGSPEPQCSFWEWWFCWQVSSRPEFALIGVLISILGVP